jgi:hypothetical protein
MDFPTVISCPGQDISWSSSLTVSRTNITALPANPPCCRWNGREAKISDLAHTGDSIEFTPAVHGRPARLRLKDLLSGHPDKAATVNGKIVSPDTWLKSGDTVMTVIGRAIAGGGQQTFRIKINLGKYCSSPLLPKKRAAF